MKRLLLLLPFVMGMSSCDCDKYFCDTDSKSPGLLSRTYFPSADWKYNSMDLSSRPRFVLPTTIDHMSRYSSTARPPRPPAGLPTTMDVSQYTSYRPAGSYITMDMGQYMSSKPPDLTGKTWLVYNDMPRFSYNNRINRQEDLKVIYNDMPRFSYNNRGTRFAYNNESA